MPLTTKEFQFSSTAGDQHGEITDYYPIIPSNSTALLTALERFIAEGSINEFQKTLQSNFIYPGIRSQWSTNNDCSRGDWWQESYASCNVRPVIEALFLEHNETFRILIKKMKESEHSEQLYQALLNSLAGTDLSKDDLFSWNTTMKQQVLIKLEHLRNYGEKLEKKGIRKGRMAIDLTNQLTSQLMTLDNINEKSNANKNLETLNMKLQLVKHLHNNDDGFGVRRCDARAINIVTLLFAGIPNLILKAATGNWLFFSKTETLERVSKVQDSLGIDHRQQIDFKL